jgi:hypothetical protein
MIIEMAPGEVHFAFHRASGVSRVKIEAPVKYASLFISMPQWNSLRPDGMDFVFHWARIPRDKNFTG